MLILMKCSISRRSMKNQTIISCAGLGRQLIKVNESRIVLLHLVMRQYHTLCLMSFPCAHYEESDSLLLDMTAY